MQMWMLRLVVIDDNGLQFSTGFCTTPLCHGKADDDDDTFPACFSRYLFSAALLADFF